MLGLCVRGSACGCVCVRACVRVCVRGAQRGRGACTPTVWPLAAADVALGGSSSVGCAHSRDGAVWHISSDARS